MPRGSTHTILMIEGGLLFTVGLFLYAEAETAQLFAQRIVLSMGVGQGLCVVELEGAGAFVDKPFLGIDGNDVGQKHVVASKGTYVAYTAFYVQRTFADEGRFDQLPLLGSEVHLLEFVVVSAAAYPAPVGDAGQVDGGEVDDELTRTLDNIVRVAFVANRDVAHGWVAAHRASPPDSDDVVVLGCVAAAHHHGGQRVDKCAGLEWYFHG